MNDPDNDHRGTPNIDSPQRSNWFKLVFITFAICVVMILYNTPVYDIYKPIFRPDMITTYDIFPEKIMDNINYGNYPSLEHQQYLNQTFQSHSLSLLKTITDFYKPIEIFSGFTQIQTDGSKKASKTVSNSVKESFPVASLHTIHNTLSLIDANYGVTDEHSTYAIPLQSLAYLTNRIQDDPTYASLNDYLSCMNKDEYIINKIPIYSDRTSFFDGKKRDISIKTKTGFIGGENTQVLPDKGPYSLSQFNIGVIGNDVVPLPDILDVVVLVLSADTPLEHTYTMVQYIDAAYMSRVEPDQNTGYVILLVIPHALKQSLPAVQALFLSAPQIHIIVATEYRGDMAKAVNNIVKNFVANDLVRAVNRVNTIRRSINEMVVSELLLPLMTVDHVNVAMIHSNTPLTVSDVLSKDTTSHKSTSSLSPSMMVSVESVVFRLFRHHSNPTPISVIASANATCLSSHLSPSVLPIFDTKHYPHMFTHKADDVRFETTDSEGKAYKSNTYPKSYGTKLSSISNIGIDVSRLTPYNSLSSPSIALSGETQMICANAIITRMQFNITHKQPSQRQPSPTALDYFLPYRLLPLPSAPPLHASLADNIESTLLARHQLERKNYIITSSLKQHMAHTWFPMSPLTPSPLLSHSEVVDLGVEYHVFNTTSVVDHIYTLSSNSTSSLNNTKDTSLKFLMPRTGSYVDGGVNTMNAVYDGYSTSCLVYYEDEIVSYHFTRKDQAKNTISLTLDNMNNRPVVDEDSSEDQQSPSPSSIHTYPSSISDFLTDSGYPTWQQIITQYNTISKFFMNTVPSYSDSFNVIGRYRNDLSPSYDKLYSITNDETAVGSIYSHLYLTGSIRVDHVFTPIVIDKGVCVMPSVYFDQFDTNPPINIHVAHNNFVNGYNIPTNDGPVLIAGLRQILHSMDTTHSPQAINPLCTTLSTLADWKRTHLAGLITLDEPRPPYNLKNSGKPKNKINSPGTIKLAILVPSRDNRSDDIIQVPFLSTNVMEDRNKQVSHWTVRNKIESQRVVEEMEHRTKKSLHSSILTRLPKMGRLYVSTMMAQNDKPPHGLYTPYRVNGLFYEWAGRQTYVQRVKTLYELGLDYHGMRDVEFYSKSHLAPPDVLTCPNPDTHTQSNLPHSHLPLKSVKATSLSQLCQSTTSSSVLYSESTTRAELQISPLGTIVESIKDTLLSIRRYYQRSNDVHKVGHDPMPFGPSIFHDVPLVEVTIYIAVDLYDKVWDDPTIMHKLRLVTDLLIGDLPINIKLTNRVHGYRSAPNWIWGELARTAYDEGNEYFLQINDDLTFHNKHWLLPLIYHYRNRPIPDFGVIGMEPSYTSRIFTQMLFSYRYMEVMNGYSYPGYTNWHGDDFVTNIFCHFPEYNAGYTTPILFNNENGRYAGISHSPTLVYEIATKQRYRFYKYLQIHFPDHPDTKKFVDEARGFIMKKTYFFDSFLKVY